ncbi:TVP38/TMEM64 family protein [Aggregicoccus sp. 17bor-14]|nr:MULTISPECIES: VTT domain-containing protein [Myxococcaceae]MBF5040929.1 TVP38/TMEM64 family protein [Simulacricoccus sp. 17bor-14]MRI86717.1 TVP38/TMEM64 family protein [Aggregicoccus sp. 17bor-14]
MSQRDLHELIAPLGRWAPLAFVAFLAVRPLLLLPGQIFTAVGGMVFGSLMASVYSLVGSFLSAALLFLVSKRFGTRLMKRVAGPSYGNLKRVAKRHDFKFALLTCINPLLPTDVMLVAAACSGARFLPTVAGVMLGTLPGTFLTAQFGSGLAQGRTVMTVVSGAGMVLSLVFGVVFGRQVYRELQEGAPPEPAPPEGAAADHGAEEPAPLAPCAAPPAT